jgi:hypothetical protein
MPEWIILAFVGAILLLLIFVYVQADYLNDLKQRLDEVAKTANSAATKLEENAVPLRQLHWAIEPKVGFVDRLKKVEERAVEITDALEAGLQLRSNAHTELQKLNNELTWEAHGIGVDVDELRGKVFSGAKPRQRMKKWAAQQAESESSGNPSYKPSKERPG